MALRKRLRPFSAVTSRARTSATPSSTLDVWLQRVSHFSQLGLFIFTVGAIYFTVIPLYQKALLDEQIARKEIELGRLQEALESAYVKIRSSVVRDFVFHSGAACSGLLLPPRPLRKLQDAPAGNEQGHAELVLEIKPLDCLDKALSSADSLKELSAQDLAFFKSQISSIGKSLEGSRQAALVRFAKAEATSRTRPHDMPSTGTADALADLLLKGQPPKFQQELLARIAVDKERNDAANQYGEEVRSKVSILRQVQWPASGSRDSGL